MDKVIYTFEADAHLENIAKRVGFSVEACVPEEGLWYESRRLALVSLDFPQPFYLDHRWERVQGHVLQKIFSRAKTVVDMTAGWGRDATLIRSMGKSVTLCEASPWVVALLMDQGESVFYGTYQRYFSSGFKRPDFAYWDPMYLPVKRKSKPSKRIQWLERLAIDTPDWSLKQVLSCVRLGVVIKRHRLSPYWQSMKPSVSYTGSSTRYDVYLV